MKERSLKSATALYLIWNQDLSGKSAPSLRDEAALARTLRLGLAGVETEFIVADDPDGSIARTKMASVYGNDVANLFFSLLDNTFVTTVQHHHAPFDLFAQVKYTHSSETLEPAITNAAANQIAYDHAANMLSFTGRMTAGVRDSLIKVDGVTAAFRKAVESLYDASQQVARANLEQPVAALAPGQISYDDFRKTLSFSGILTDETRDKLTKARRDKELDLPPFKDALQNLYAENRKVVGPFFDRYPELKSLYDAYMAATSGSVTERRSALLKDILPELIKRRKRQLVLQSLSTAANVDLAFTQLLLDSPSAPFPLR
jgi:hypothetical protein